MVPSRGMVNAMSTELVSEFSVVRLSDKRNGKSSLNKVIMSSQDLKSDIDRNSKFTISEGFRSHFEFQILGELKRADLSHFQTKNDDVVERTLQNMYHVILLLTFDTNAAPHVVLISQAQIQMWVQIRFKD